MKNRQRLSGVLLAGLFTLQSSFSMAGLGSYLNGAGANNRALSGAGVAFAEDGMVMAVNPAGLVLLEENQWQVGALLLTAHQSAKATEVNPATAPPGAFPLAPGKRSAEPDVPAEVEHVFPIPFGSMYRRIDDRNSVGVVVYGNGGININYQAFDNPSCPPGTPGRGYLCFGDTASDIAQVFIAPTWSHAVNDRLRLGISPELIYQTIEINGFQIFAPASAQPDRLSNNGHSGSFGYGVKLGGSFNVRDDLIFGLTLQSRGYMQKQDEYAGLLAEQGSLDIPPYLQFGLAWKIKPKLTLMADFQRIYFSKVKAYANPGNAPGRYGDDNGPGFGWGDIAAVKFGIHYQFSPTVTLRFGATDVVRKPYGSEEVVSNLVSSAVFDERINGGFSWAFGEGSILDVAINYVPKQELSGENPRFPGQIITTSNRLFSLDVGWRRQF